jgi:2-methylcitrate dehydratase PrpD
MAAARLLDLTDEEAAWALGNAGAQASGVWEFLSAGAMSKHLHTARAAESGVIAARLAMEGFTGARTILEGEKGFLAAYCADPDPQAVLADPQAPWQLTRTSLKPWPCCRHTQPTIDAALSLHARIAGRPIRSVDVGTYRAALDLCDRADVSDMTAAKFSLQHCVAAALADGAIWTDSFEAEARERLSALRRTVKTSHDAEAETAYPRDWGAHVVVTLDDGERLEARCTACKGDPENPLSPSEIEQKARLLLAAGGWTQTESDRLIERIRALPAAAAVGDLVYSALAGVSVQPAMRPSAAKG